MSVGTEPQWYQLVLRSDGYTWIILNPFEPRLLEFRLSIWMYIANWALDDEQDLFDL